MMLTKTWYHFLWICQGQISNARLVIELGRHCTDGYWQVPHRIWGNRGIRWVTVDIYDVSQNFERGNGRHILDAEDFRSEQL